MTMTSLGILSFRNDGLKILTQRKDRRYDWELMNLGLWVVEVCPERQSLHEDSRDTSILEKDRTAAEPGLDH